MQIDFHHAATYVVSRLAGFDHEAASVVAHAAQYVDDATHDGALDFVTGERYVRVTSAHKTFDIKLNGNEADNRLVWVPFHFLPGNEQPPAGIDAKEAYLRRMMCKPDSAVARAMVLDCVRRQDLPFALHRLGIALHTYVDTWAHQQFVGVLCELNRLKDVTVDPDPAYVDSDVYGDLASGLSRLEGFIAGHLPVGHAAALTLPDMPFLRWRFTRRNGDRVVRDNPTDFLAAAHGAFNMARRYLAHDTELADTPLPEADAAAIDRLLRTTLMIEGESRHAAWLQEIAQGSFSFGPATVDYIDHGDGSWKMQALGHDPDDDDDVQFEFDPVFLASHWKHFHDAVQHHRLFIVHELLPRFGLCAS
jgi:hypothetical protein